MGYFQDEVWSTIPEPALAAAVRTGYGPDFPSRYAGIPFPAQEDVSSTFPVALSRPHALLPADRGRILPPRDLVPPPPQPPGHQQMLASIGSCGHPNDCERPCKYVWKKKGCRDGAKCLHCHFCRPQKIAQPGLNTNNISQEPVPQGVSCTKPLSIGSIGHPHSCASACKYNRKSAGCKDGTRCNRCHVCRWSRCTDREKKDNEEVEVSEQKEPNETCEMSTQTSSVAQTTQC